jgi:hypothetical protein
VKGGFVKRGSLARETLTWDLHTTFVTSKGGLTKGVVFQEGGLSKGGPLYLPVSMYPCMRKFTVRVYVFSFLCV